MPKKKLVVPEILRVAMRAELEKVVAFPREVIENEDVPIVDRLAAYELLAKYGIGVQKEVSGEVRHTHGVVHLPPLATGNLQLGAGGPQGRLDHEVIPGELTVEPDEIEVTD